MNEYDMIMIMIFEISKIEQAQKRKQTTCYCYNASNDNQHTGHACMALINQSYNGIPLHKIHTSWNMIMGRRKDGAVLERKLPIARNNHYDEMKMIIT
jgi:hypothetical protein